MGKEKRKILEMLSKGKIGVDEAEKLLNAISSDHAGTGEKTVRANPDGTKKLKYLRVIVEPGEGSGKKEKVNVRVPIKLIRSGIKWVSLIPKEAQKKVNETFKEKGIDMDFTKLKEEDLEELVENLRDLTVDVEGDEKVKVFCE
jgi:hypothetical protein